MIQLTRQYSQNSVRLTIQGLPDISVGQTDDVIGIISSWKLELVGSTELEGKLEHLQSLMSTIYPYARYLISGINKSFGNESSPITISPNLDSHNLTLRSSQKGVSPLNLDLDDAELADLVRCLDELRKDDSVVIRWNYPLERPLTKKELVGRVPILQRVCSPILGIALVTLLGSILLVSKHTPKSDQQDPQKSLLN